MSTLLAAAVQLHLVAAVAAKTAAPMPQPLTTVVYDEAKGDTSVGFSEAEAYSKSEEQVLLTVSCDYKGRTPTPPDQCLVIFTTRSPKQAYCEDMNYVVSAEGEPLFNLQAKNYGCDQNGAAWVANLFALWRFDQLSRVANSKELSFKLGKLEFRAPDQVLNGIRDIRKHFKP